MCVCVCVCVRIDACVRMHIGVLMLYMGMHVGLYI